MKGRFITFKCPHCELWQAWHVKFMGRYQKTRSCSFCCTRIDLSKIYLHYSNTWKDARALVLSFTRREEEAYKGGVEQPIKPSELEGGNIPNPITIKQGDICGYMQREKVPCPGPNACSVSQTCKYGGATFWQTKQAERVI